jgi:hypothetical protein
MSEGKMCPACGQSLPENGGDAARIRAVWPKVQAAAKGYGKDWRTLTPPRMKLMIARLREQKRADPSCTEDILWQAVHGAAAFWKQGRGSHDGFDPRAYLVPETVFRASKFSQYLESYVPQPCASPATRALVERALVPNGEPLLSREEGVRQSQEIAARLQRSMTARKAREVRV